MVVRETGHEVVAVVIVWLHAQLHALVDACFFGGGYEVFGEELPLFVEVVAGALGYLMLTSAHFTGYLGWWGIGEARG